MHAKTLFALLAVALAGCSGPHDSDGVFVSVIGTPFLVAFKIPTCAATIALAAPLAGVSALAKPSITDPAFYPDSDSNRELRRDLDAGLTQNCAPPYIVTQ
jgi:class 3 adenylate cyclase